MEIQRIIDLLEKSFYGSAWHGLSVMESLGRFKSSRCLANAITSQSIIELALPMELCNKTFEGNNEFEVFEKEN